MTIHRALRLIRRLALSLAMGNLTALLVLPMLIAVQEACARIGAVTGKGISAVVKDG